MVTIGDEGKFASAQGYGNSYPYSCNDAIDYGTVHMYPLGTTWISQHGDQAKSIGKPVVLRSLARQTWILATLSMAS
ncbi:hypothetical protein V501_09204 [Pseudogymnoascus sp. VKM F-4519 (FW-2642)]|nr:hypothetical protein V501_09204 [Pseudogymnoascus sp. VKM F-4519 (FW-2642)]